MNLRYLLILWISFFFCSGLYSQDKRDYQWIMGGNSAGNGFIMDFNTQPVSIFEKQTGIRMEGSNTSMCDKEGNLLFYSNGCFIANANNEIMENGDGINPGLLNDIWCSTGGVPMIQGVLSVPLPESDSLYYLFNLDYDQTYVGVDSFTGLAPERLYFQVIDISLNNGLGAVILKNQIAIQDTFARGSIKAVQHTNEKDWWIIVPKSHSNCYFISLLNNDGLQPAILDCEGHIWSDDDGAQVSFTPNGTKYLRYNYDNALTVIDFDPTTGDFFNGQTISFPEDSLHVYTGVSVSPNSRYLYLSARKKLYQFDLEASDIGGSIFTVAEWDGFSNPGPTFFFLSSLASNDKIYIASFGSTSNLHVIHRPNCKGTACQVEQHGIELPAFNFITIPNFPHYRNESGSTCDTTIVSTHIIPDEEIAIQLYPNPFQDQVIIDINLLSETPLTFQLFDLIGRPIIRHSFHRFSNEVNLTNLEDGLYFYQIIDKEKVIKKGKLIKGTAF